MLCRGSLHPRWLSTAVDLFPSYLISPAKSDYDPVTSLITPALQEDADFLPPDSKATMDQCLSLDKDLLLGDTADLPLLSLPLQPRPVTDDSVPGSSVVSRAGEPVVPSDVMPDFDVHQDALESGAAPRVLRELTGMPVSHDVLRCCRPIRSGSGIWFTLT